MVFNADAFASPRTPPATCGTSWLIAVPASVERQAERGRADRLPIVRDPFLLTERKRVRRNASAAGRLNKIIKFVSIYTITSSQPM